MNKILTACLLSLTISSGALASEVTKGSPDWLSQNEVPETIQVVSPEATANEVANTEVAIELPEGNDIQEALGLGLQLVQAVQAGQMQLVLGLLLMILIWSLKSFWSSFPPDVVPWLAAVIAVAGSAAIGLVSGWPWEKILTDALTISTSAGGLWSLLGKHIAKIDFSKNKS